MLSFHTRIFRLCVLHNIGQEYTEDEIKLLLNQYSMYNLSVD
jgi:hypothetical protein